MSRHGYTDGDVDDMASFMRVMGWRNAVKSAMRGKRGQAFLRELAEALDALNPRELSAASFTRSGQICALGSVALKRGLDVSHLEQEPDENDEFDEFDDNEDPVDEAAGKTFGIARSMAAEIMYENDEGPSRETPAERWIRVRAWV